MFKNLIHITLKRSKQLLKYLKVVIYHFIAEWGQKFYGGNGEKMEIKYANYLKLNMLLLLILGLQD